MNDELKMAELLCTRLCHDLTGPIGAVSNGAEFLSDEGFNMQNQAVELIVSSAFSAVTRLQFYRMAYGSVKEGGEANLSEKQKLAADFFAGNKITLDWPDDHAEASGVSISTKMARLIYNLLIVAGSVLMRGGVLSVRLHIDDKSAKHLQIIAKGTHVRFDKEIGEILDGGGSLDDMDPKNVQIRLTKFFADDLHATLTHKVEAEQVTFDAVQKAA